MAGYIGNVPVPEATQTRESFTAVDNQTTFNTSSYSPGFLDVYLNGSHLKDTEFTATNGSQVVLTTPASAGDVIQVVSFTTFKVFSNTVTTFPFVKSNGASDSISLTVTNKIPFFKSDGSQGNISLG
jgi:hypothetical protein